MGLTTGEALRAYAEGGAGLDLTRKLAHRTEQLGRLLLLDAPEYVVRDQLRLVREAGEDVEAEVVKWLETREAGVKALRLISTGLPEELPKRERCILDLDSPSYPPEDDERRQCGCLGCLRDLARRGI